MKTLETQIKRTLHQEAGRLPDIDDVSLVKAFQHSPGQTSGRRIRFWWVAIAAFAGVLLLLGPLTFVGEQDNNYLGGQGYNDVAAPSRPAIVADGVPNVTLSEVDAVENSPPASDYGASVAQTLATTGLSYDQFPDITPDAAVSEGRAVIVGGNSGRVAGIWFSDGGTWIPAQITFPEGVTIGESEGDYRLADGIQNVEATGQGFVAWEPVQIVNSSDVEDVGTLIFASADGAVWSAILTPERVGTLVPWGSGYVSTFSSQIETGETTSRLMWSTDLATWNEIADLGEGYAFAATGDADGVTVWLRVYETEVAEDGSISVFGDGTVRVLRLALD